jgi:large subunit ribosomal protein L1
MGKIRVKTFGDEEQEKKELEKKKQKKEAKKAEKALEVKVEVSQVPVLDDTSETKDVKTKEEPKKEKVKVKKEQKAFRSEKYDELVKLVDRTKNYSLTEGLELLEKLQRKSFDETVELHLNTVSTGISGNVLLPNGTGKTTKVAVADDKLIQDIEKGIIDFDILVAEPSMMPKLARVAKILGPRGLMPNPKNGTITEKSEEVAKKYEGGQVNYKTEAKAPLMHLTVGKVSFGPTKLSQNIETYISAVKKQNIVSATLKSTMSPGIKIKV